MQQTRKTDAKVRNTRVDLSLAVLHACMYSQLGVGRENVRDGRAREETHIVCTRARKQERERGRERASRAISVARQNDAQSCISVAAPGQVARRRGDTDTPRALALLSVTYKITRRERDPSAHTPASPSCYLRLTPC